MTDVKRLLRQATPLPWFDGGDIESVALTIAEQPYIDQGGSDQWPADKALILHAVNRLPDYQLAVEALEILVTDLDREDVAGMSPRIWESYGLARTVLRRLETDRSSSHNRLDDATVAVVEDAFRERTDFGVFGTSDADKRDMHRVLTAIFGELHGIDAEEMSPAAPWNDGKAT